MFLFNIARRKMGLIRLHRTAATIRRNELTAQLRPVLGNQVLSGPFQGMILPESVSWRDGDFMPKLLGSYESNLRAVVLQAVQRAPAAVINIGCAEGYYAIGLARAIPPAVVYAFDSDRAATAICTQAAELNGVTDRVIVGGQSCLAEISRILDLHEHVLLFLDCEGAERELLDPTEISNLANCDIIVETHGDDIVDELISRFGVTHTVVEIEQGGRNPNEQPELHRLHESDRWLLMDEGRPESMRWLAFWSNAQSGSTRRVA
jgi:hypothetical protein